MIGARLKKILSSTSKHQMHRGMMTKMAKQRPEPSASRDESLAPCRLAAENLTTSATSDDSDPEILNTDS